MDTLMAQVENILHGMALTHNMLQTIKQIPGCWLVDAAFQLCHESPVQYGKMFYFFFVCLINVNIINKWYILYYNKMEHFNI